MALDSKTKEYFNDPILIQNLSENLKFILDEVDANEAEWLSACILVPISTLRHHPRHMQIFCNTMHSVMQLRRPFQEQYQSAWYFIDKYIDFMAIGSTLDVNGFPPEQFAEMLEKAKALFKEITVPKNQNTLS